MAQGVPGRLRPRIISKFGTTRVVGRQPYVPAAFTPGEIPVTHFQKLSRPQGTWFCRKEPLKKSQVTPPGIDLTGGYFWENVLKLLVGSCECGNKPSGSIECGAHLD